MCLAKLRFHSCTKPPCIHPSLGFILASYRLHFASFSHHLVSLISTLQSLAFRLLPLHLCSQNQHFTSSILHFAYPTFILTTLTLIPCVINIILSLHPSFRISLYCLPYCDITLETLAPKIASVSDQFTNCVLKLPTAYFCAPTAYFIPKYVFYTVSMHLVV